MEQRCVMGGRDSGNGRIFVEAWIRGVDTRVDMMISWLACLSQATRWCSRGRRHRGAKAAEMCHHVSPTPDAFFPTPTNPSRACLQTSYHLTMNAYLCPPPPPLSLIEKDAADTSAMHVERSAIPMNPQGWHSVRAGELPLSRGGGAAGGGGGAGEEGHQ